MYLKIFKRIFDLFLSIIILPFVVFIILVIAFLIWIEDRGPIFYHSERIGKKGVIFRMHKLRSMKINSPDIRIEDGSTWNSKDDPRVTRIGKFIRQTSVDELPQLFNVIKGDMSIVGPRPLLKDQLYLYDVISIRALAVLPGITGYNQAYFRNSLGAQEIFTNDVYYADNVSFALDMKILFATAIAIMRRNNVYSLESDAANKVAVQKERETIGNERCK
jgi:undecaprenyl phosphate N,N'-diacetylbacillosamine 1-phosphate transferase